MDSSKNKIYTGFFVVLVLLAGFYMLMKRNKAEEKIIDNNVATSTDKGVVLDTNSSDYTVEQVPIENKKQVSTPDLNRKVVFGSDVSLTVEVRKMVTEKILSLQNNLKKDKTNLNDWINLGLYQKMAGDYDGAVLSWKYVGEVANKDFISYGNLGDLYGYYLHNNALSETYYRKAIENGPTNSYLYVQLAMFYKDVFKDMTKAQAILDEGLKRIPNDPSLLETKNNL